MQQLGPGSQIPSGCCISKVPPATYWWSHLCLQATDDYATMLFQHERQGLWSFHGVHDQHRQVCAKRSRSELVKLAHKSPTNSQGMHQQAVTMTCDLFKLTSSSCRHTPFVIAHIVMKACRCCLTPWISCPDLTVLSERLQTASVPNLPTCVVTTADLQQPICHLSLCICVCSMCLFIQNQNFERHTEAMMQQLYSGASMANALLADIKPAMQVHAEQLQGMDRQLVELHHAQADLSTAIQHGTAQLHLLQSQAHILEAGMQQSLQNEASTNAWLCMICIQGALLAHRLNLTVGESSRHRRHSSSQALETHFTILITRQS